jgi:hypothetical protein
LGNLKQLVSLGQAINIKIKKSAGHPFEDRLNIRNAKMSMLILF